MASAAGDQVLRQASQEAEDSSRVLVRFLDLIELSENGHLDFKMIHYDVSNDGKCRDFLKDVVSMYNSFDAPLNGIAFSRSAFIIFGVKLDEQLKRHLVPLKQSLDPIYYQHLLLRNCKPVINARYHHIEYGGGVYGMMEIAKGSMGPAFLVKPDQKPLFKDEKDTSPLWTRHGLSGNYEAMPLSEESEKVLKLFEKQFSTDVTLGRIEPMAIKILIVDKTPPSQSLHLAIGSIAWDIVFDFDPKSDQDGGLRNGSENAETVFGKEVTPVSLHKLTERHFKDLQARHKTLWIYANGHARDGMEAPKNLKLVVKEKVEPRFLEFCKHAGSQPLAIVTIVFGLVCEKNQISLLGTLIDTYSVLVEDESKENTITSVLFHQNGLTQKKYIPEITCVYDCPDEQMAYLLMKSFSTKHTSQDEVTLPGISSPFTLKTHEIQALESSLLLYHSGRGRDFDDLVKDLATQEDGDVQHKDIGLNFLKGKEIDFTFLRMNEASSMYFIQRKPVKELKNALMSRLCGEPATFFRPGAKNLYMLAHHRSAGGTAGAKWILWELRSVIPCLQIITSTFDMNLVQKLEILYRRSQRPLLILIDLANVSPHDVKQLSQTLSEKTTKAAILHVHRVSPNVSLDQLQGDFKDRHVTFLPSKVEEPADLVAFRELFARVSNSDSGAGSKMSKVNRIHFWALFAFSEEFIRIDALLQDYLTSRDLLPSERDFLRILAFLTDRDVLVAMDLAKFLLDLPLHDNQPLRPHLQEMTVSVTSTEEGQVFIKSPHAYVSKKLMKIDAEDLPPSTQLYNVVNLLLDKLSVAPPSVNVKAVLDRLLTRNATERLPALIDDLHRECGKDLCKSLLSKASDNFADMPHIRAHYGRYLLHPCAEIDAAIKVTEMAVQVDEKDRALQAMLGDCYRRKLQHIASQPLEAESVDDQASIMESLCNKAIQRYDKVDDAEGFQWVNSFSFLGRIKSHICVVKWSFIVRFNQNQKRFIRFLRSEDSSLMHHVQQAINQLDELTRSLESECIKGNVNEVKRDVFCQKVELSKYLFDDVSVSNENEKDKSRLAIQMSLYSCKLIQSRNVRSICELPSSDLDDVVLTLQRKLDEFANKCDFVRSDFMDLLMAMIARAQHPDCTHNLASAIVFAERWRTMFPEDHRSHFFAGLLRIVQGILKKEPDEDAALLLKKSRETLPQQNGNAYWKKKFLLCKGKGLAMLVPSEMVNETKLAPLPGVLLQTERKPRFSLDNVPASVGKIRITNKTAPELLPFQDQQRQCFATVCITYDDFFVDDVQFP